MKIMNMKKTVTKRMTIRMLMAMVLPLIYVALLLPSMHINELFCEHVAPKYFVLYTVICLIYTQIISRRTVVHTPNNVVYLHQQYNTHCELFLFSFFKKKTS